MLLRALACALLWCAGTSPLQAQPSGFDPVVAARDALRKRDRAQLVALRQATARHPLAPWVEYWELSNRLDTAQSEEVEAFYARWAGSYVEDRLRNDWLLELGKRRDWPAIARDHPRFRMNDDREVHCYALLAQPRSGPEAREAARAAWLAQRELDDGCQLLAATLLANGSFTANDAWTKARSAMDAGRTRVAQAAAALLSAPSGAAVAELVQNPARWLARGPAPRSSLDEATLAELSALAASRLAATDPDAAAAALEGRALSPALAAWAWAQVGKQAALKLQPQASAHFQRAGTLWRGLNATQQQAVPWGDEALAWQLRAALRSGLPAAERWGLVAAAVPRMSTAEQQQGAWVYWQARARLALAPAGESGEDDRALARQQLRAISGELNFYGKLASEELGTPQPLPAKPSALSAEERQAARQHPGLQRALQLITLGLRSEGVREWNFSLRGMTDRELLAAADWACERQVWDRCISTSDRTQAEVDLTQRFPRPFRTEVLAKAREAGLDPAYVYALIRQESRFIPVSRSHVGATGLMQLMPTTASWTAQRIGLRIEPDQVADPELNLRLGTTYLKLLLDDFNGSQPLAAAAYNAGPNRPRRWREGPPVEPAAWAESIPFNETRDYVKKVLSNAVYYGALLGAKSTSLKARLGPPIGPRAAGAAPPDTELP